MLIYFEVICNISQNNICKFDDIGTFGDIGTGNI